MDDGREHTIESPDREHNQSPDREHTNESAEQMANRITEQFTRLEIARDQNFWQFWQCTNNINNMQEEMVAQMIEPTRRAVAHATLAKSNFSQRVLRFLNDDFNRRPSYEGNIRMVQWIQRGVNSEVSYTDFVRDICQNSGIPISPQLNANLTNEFARRDRLLAERAQMNQAQVDTIVESSYIPESHNPQPHDPLGFNPGRVGFRRLEELTHPHSHSHPSNEDNNNGRGSGSGFGGFSGEAGPSASGPSGPSQSSGGPSYRTDASSIFSPCQSSSPSPSQLPTSNPSQLPTTEHSKPSDPIHKTDVGLFEKIYYNIYIIFSSVLDFIDLIINSWFM